MQTASEYVLQQLAPLLVDAPTETTVTNLVEALTTPFGDVTDVADSETHQGLGLLLDVDECPDWDVPWLGQFVGTVKIDGLDVATQREEVRDRPSWRRGTLGPVVSAAKATLTGSKFVFFDARYLGSPYRPLLVTRTSETPDPALTFARTKAALPAGRVLTHTVSSVLTYAEVEALFATYTLAEAAYTHYSDIP